VKYASHFREPGEASFRSFFLIYRRSAAARDYSFGLSFETFRVMTQDACHYCGRKPRPYNKYLKKDGSPVEANGKLVIRKENVERAWILVNGLDRKDNGAGYTAENTVTCCSICNHAKHTMSYEEFLDYLNDLVQFRT